MRNSNLKYGSGFKRAMGIAFFIGIGVVACGESRALADETVTNDDPVAIEELRAFTGTVVDEAGAPVADARVEWGHFQAPQSEREFTFTDANGEYRLETTRAWQDFRLGVHKPGYGPRWFDGLIPSRVGSVVDFVLPPSKTVTGIVVYPDGEPMPGVNVIAQPGRYEVQIENTRTTVEPGYFPGPARAATTNEQGEFVVRDVAEVVLSNSETGIPEVKSENVQLTFTGESRWAFREQTPIGVPGQFEVFSSHSLATEETAGVASGIVVDGSTLRPITDFQARWKFLTDGTDFVSADGQFTLSEVFLQGDEVEVEVFAAGYAPASAGIVAAGADEKPTAMIRLMPHAPLVCEVVNSLTGEPMPNVEIHAGVFPDGRMAARWTRWENLRQFHFHDGLIQQQRVTTDAAGRAVFLEGESPNDFYILHPGYARKFIIPEDRERMMTEDKVLRIELAPEAVVSGKILLPPVPGAEFQVYVGRMSPPREAPDSFFKNVVEDFSGEGELNEAGEFMSERLSGGTYAVVVTLTNGRFDRAYWRTEFKVLDGEHVHIEVGAPAGPHTLTGIAPPYSTLQLKQFSPEGPLMFAGYADADGRFEIAGIPEGIYEVDIGVYSASRGIYRSRRDFVQIAGDTERDFTATPLLDE